jgi:chromosome segregation ATPase
LSKQEKATQKPGTKDERERSFGDLSDAALALQRELARFEELAASARRLPLDTRRGIERAARATTEATEGQDRVSASLGALVAAINAARERHAANAAALQARGEEIRDRADELGALHERYGALGEEGKAINQLVLEAAALQREATTPAAVRELVVTLEGIEERMSKLASVARDLARAATAATMSDIAEQSDALKQQIAAARNKLGLLRKGLVEKLSDPTTLH